MEAEMPSLPYSQLCRKFSLDEIQSATQNFDDALVIGKGGFGKVYKAAITVENGETFIVAIKRLNLDSSQGATEFWAEIEMLTKLRHCNLVSLIGYCNEHSEMILIYEFMPHGTLDDHLHKKGTSLSWVQRLKISIGAARGLHYLHTGTGTQHGVIHRDVKSTNILLDKDYAAKISDFGLAKIGPTNASGAYVNTNVRGTFGYLDPEYFLTGRATMKTDVFAFGVVLFELLCGRVAVLDNGLEKIHEASLAMWALDSIKQRKVHNIIDLKIRSQISQKCLKEFVQIAHRCLSSESEKRPKMAEIVVALECSLSLQNKFDTTVKPAAGISSISRIIKWPFISTEVNSAQSDTKPLTINEDTIEHSSSQKQDTIDQNEVVPFGDMPDHLNHVAEHSDGILSLELKKFSYDDLKKATRNFRPDRVLGAGNLGDVFVCYMDTNTSSLSAVSGTLRIAIKRFDYFKIQHNNKLKEVVDETFLSKFNHPNLVKVLGYCYEDYNLCLIYEFMEKGSLDNHLFRRNIIKPLSWKTRVKITLGIAEALLFLESTQNLDIYRIIRPQKILLDKDFNAKISYVEFSNVDLHTNPLYYHEDPLYYHPAVLNVSDCQEESTGNIHAFGQLLVQILTGERDSKIGVKNLRDSTENQRGKHLKESLMRALDPRLSGVDNTTIKEAIKLAGVALSCLDDPSYTMNSALDALKQLSLIKRDVHIRKGNIQALQSNVTET